MNVSLIPWWWKLGGAALALVALFVAAGSYESHLISKGDAIGYARAKGERVREEAKIKADAELAASAETNRARAETAAVQLKFDQLGDSQQKARIDHEISKNIAVAAALAGTERLSVPSGAGAGSALREAGTVEGAAAGARVAPEARADLLPGVSAVLFRFAGDYGQLVRDYNAVLERYEIARASCNAGD
jgi:hypothetical protein